MATEPMSLSISLGGLEVVGDDGCLHVDGLQQGQRLPVLAGRVSRQYREQDVALGVYLPKDNLRHGLDSAQATPRRGG